MYIGFGTFESKLLMKTKQTHNIDFHVVNAEIYCAKCSSTFWGNQCRIHTPRVMLTHNTDQCRNWRDDGSSKWYAKKNLPPMSEVVDDDSSTSSEMTQQCIVVKVMSIIFYVLYCCEYYLPEIHD